MDRHQGRNPNYHSLALYEQQVTKIESGWGGMLVCECYCACVSYVLLVHK
jgi:hypothetical protein